jgi:hypothetical protein
MNPIKKINLIVCLLLFLFLSHCRNDELDVIKTYSPTQNPIFGLVYYILPGQGFSFSGGGSSIPRGFKSSGGALFAIGSSASLYESTDGNTFTKKTFTIPGCTVVNGFSSGANFTECNIVTVAKSGSTIYAIGIKQSGVRGSNFSDSSVTDHKFFFGSGSTLNDLNFVEISDNNFASTRYQAGNILPSAASTNGFIFGFAVSSSAVRYCGTGNNGSSWVCQNSPSTGSSAGMVELLNGTLVADIYFRWNGSGFTAAVTSNQGSKNSSIYSGGRTIYNSGNQIRFTTTDPSAWSGTSVTGETTATQTGAPTSSYNWIGNFGGTMKAIGTSFNNNVNTYTAHTSSDNGTNWSNQGTISLPGGLSLNTQIGSLNDTVFVYGQTTGGTFLQKYFKSTDFSNWTEITP